MGNVSSANSSFPVAAIIAISVAAWTVFILIFIAVRYVLLYKGVCKAGCDCNPCGTEGGPPCCECCVACGESCACRAPSVQGCLNTCCPKKKLSCVEIILCQCFGDNCCTNFFSKKLDEWQFGPPGKGCSEVQLCGCTDEGVTCCCCVFALKGSNSEGGNGQSTVTKPDAKSTSASQSLPNILFMEDDGSSVKGLKELPKGQQFITYYDEDLKSLVCRSAAPSEVDAQSIRTRGPRSDFDSQSIRTVYRSRGDADSHSIRTFNPQGSRSDFDNHSMVTFNDHRSQDMDTHSMRTLDPNVSRDYSDTTSVRSLHLNQQGSHGDLDSTSVHSLRLNPLGLRDDPERTSVHSLRLNPLGSRDDPDRTSVHSLRLNPLGSRGDSDNTSVRSLRLNPHRQRGDPDTHSMRSMRTLNPQGSQVDFDTASIRTFDPMGSTQSLRTKPPRASSKAIVTSQKQLRRQ